MSIKLNNANLSIDNSIILKDICINFNEGKSYCIIGANGSGKSSLLKIISGNYPINSGSIEFSQKRNFRDVFYLPHIGSGLYNNFTPHHNLIYFARKHGITDVESIINASSIFDVDMNSKLPLYRLSTGQRHRILLALSSIVPHSFIVLDEPTLSIDSDTSNSLVNTIYDLKRSGKTIITATHDIGFAKRISDDIAYMHTGQIEHFSSRDEFFRDFVLPYFIIYFFNKKSLTDFANNLKIDYNINTDKCSISIPINSMEFSKLDKYKNDFRRIEMEERLIHV